MKDEIVLYRYKVSERSMCPAATLIAGIEICSDSTIEQVVTSGNSITNLSDVVELGVPTEHAKCILDIVLSYKQ